MSYKEILDNVTNIENLDNVTILKTLQKFSRAIRDFAEKQTGLENLLNVEFVPNDNAITYGDGVVDYLGNLKITLTDNIIVNKPCSVKFNIKGSETIIVDVDEFDNALEIHLDSEIVNKIERALLLPLNSPSEREFVGIGPNNEQIMIPESEINNKINKKLLKYYYTGDDVISVQNSVLTDLKDYKDLFKQDRNKIYKCSMGEGNSILGNLLGNPFNDDEYRIYLIKEYIAGNTYPVWEITCYKIYNYIAKRYLIENSNNGSVTLTPWIKGA